VYKRAAILRLAHTQVMEVTPYEILWLSIDQSEAETYHTAATALCTSNTNTL